MIRFVCGCGRQLQARDEDVGKKAKCPACGQITSVPSESTPSAPASEEDSPRTSTPRPDAIREYRPVRAAAKRSRPEDDDEDFNDRDDEDYDDRDDDRPRKRRSRPSSEVSSGKATAALVLGLVSLCLPILPAIPGLILGILALREIGRSKGRLAGRGAAIAGIVTSCLSFIVLIPVFILYAVMMPAVSKVRDASARMQDSNNLKQIGIALHNFHDVHQGFPRAAAFRTRDGRPGLSWRVALLPYLEQKALYDQFNLEEAWDSPTNRPLLARIPQVYLLPKQLNDGSGLTHYQVLVGKSTIFEEPAGGLNLPAPGGKNPLRGISFREIVDGTSNTILVTTASMSVPWTKPEDLTFDPAGPLPGMGGMNPAGYNVLFADGSVRFMQAGTPEQTLKHLITRNGGEAVFP